jgi:integrase/recombinase XerD
MNHLPENHSGASNDTQLLNLWLAGRPDSTVAVYRPVAEEFLAFLGKSLQEATVADVSDWAEKIPGAEQTRARKVSTIKSLFSFAHRTGYCVFNVAKILIVPKAVDTLHERILEVEEVKNVIKGAHPGRDAALLRFLYNSGVRISEAVHVRFCDIKGNRVTLHGKGKKTRTVLVSPDIIKAMLAIRWVTDQNTAYVFKSYRGKRLEERNARQIVKAAAEEAGIEMSPHWFRHAHATHSLDNGAKLHVLQRQLGHKNLATTSRYIHARPNDGTAEFLEDV